MVATKWPLARIMLVKTDRVVRVVTLNTHAGTYTRPVVKIVTL